MINGEEVSSPTTGTAFETAQKALLAQIMRMPMHPNQAAISAYANGMLQSARLSALVDMVLARLSADESARERFETQVAEQLDVITRTLMEAERSQGRIQIASSLKN